MSEIDKETCTYSNRLVTIKTITNMTKQSLFTILLTVLMSMTGAKAFAHDIAVANDDGVIIYYKWSNYKTELSVSYATKEGLVNSDMTTREIIITGTGEATVVGDVNKDGKVDVADHVKLSDIIMNKK